LISRPLGAKTLHDVIAEQEAAARARKTGDACRFHDICLTIGGLNSRINYGFHSVNIHVILH